MPIPRATCLMLAAVLLLCGCTPEATFYGTHDEGCETLDNLFLYGGQAPYAAGLPLLLFGGQWLAGAQCNEIYYTPPPELGENRNSGVANQPLDQVWPRIIAQIGKSGFKLLRTSKKSGMIELRYVGNPEPYVNCGQLHGNGDPDMNYQTVSSADGSFGGSKGWRSSADYTQQTSLTA
ncbi:MAG TPA: hypothetical protein VMT58_00500, partial [Candidatus Binataceae bacterium]|nr:hypothetical protein [Candidatus Binataceae bacterium]